MNVLLVLALTALVLGIAARTYPFAIARRFNLNDGRPTPAVARADGSDFVASPTHVVFAHHFASIAGAGPIVGPVLALAFGWGWAWLWVVFGAIFFGAVQDMSAMCVSIREGGGTIAEVARRTLGAPAYLIFVAFLLLVISVVNAVFLKLTADALTSAYPLEALGLGADQSLLAVIEKEGVPHGVLGGIATTSVIVMTLFAPIIGWLITRVRMRGALATLIAAAVCLGSIGAGFVMPVRFSPESWTAVLTIYVVAACALPVWILLQPRDFMNVQILYAGVALLVAGAIVCGVRGGGMEMPISSVEAAAPVRGMVWPMLFITIACGAISGFHGLVATGTTVRQIPRESDCRRVGYNAMLLESLLAVLVLVAVGSQMTGEAYAAGLRSSGGPIQTFAIGCGGLFSNLGLPMAVGCVLGILIVEGFIVTTLDTSVRLSRYLCEELFAGVLGSSVPAFMRSKAFNTLVAVALMLLFWFSQRASQALWPYFGAGNQLIGAFTLITVSVWLMQRGGRAWFALVPAALMTVTAFTALLMLVYRELGNESNPLRWIVVSGGVLLVILAGGFIGLSAARIARGMRVPQAHHA